METDGEGKFVSFKVVLGGRLHCSSKWITVPIAWCITFIGARRQLRGSSWWIQGQTSEEKSLKKFFFVWSRCCGQNVDLDRRRSWRSYHRSITLLRLFVRHVGESAFTATVWREGEQSRKSGKRDQVDILCRCFFRCTARWWPVRNELFFINGAVDGTSGERFLTIAFRISSVKYCVYFLVVCLFFSALPHWFSKKKWTRNIKNKRHALSSSKHNAKKKKYNSKRPVSSVDHFDPYKRKREAIN